MFSSKFIQFFLQLDRRERQNLKLWVNSPIANAREDVVSLFQYLFSKREITKENTEKRTVFAFVYLQEPYEEQKMRYLMSFASKCIESFFAYFNWQQTPQMEIDKIHYINEKQLNSYCHQQIVEVRHQLKQQPLRNSQHYWYAFQLEVEEYNLSSKNKRNIDFNLQEVSNQLHYFTIAEILKQACIAISIERVSAQSFDFPLLKSCLALVEETPTLKEIPAIYMYFVCYRLSVDGGDDNFEELDALLHHNEAHFTQSEIKDVFIIALNHCIKELNLGKSLYAQHAYRLYLRGLEKGFLLENGMLSRFTFKNIAFIGIKKLRDYEGVLTFIHNYQHYLHENYREGTVMFNMATLFVEQKRYEKAMPILQTIEFEDVLWNINAKSMLLRIFYEEQEFESMLMVCNSFKQYLKRQKEIGEYKISYLNLIKYCEKLLKHNGCGNLKKSKLLLIAGNESNLFEKEWVLEMVRKL
jgi:hypothetical protein